MNQNYKIIDITIPKEGRVVRLNSWWLCVNGDPQKALFYNSSPQCNSDKKIADWILTKTNVPESVSVVFIETAYILPRKN